MRSPFFSTPSGPDRTARFLLAGLGISFFGLLFLAAALYPGHYDWRYRVISSLASPRDNLHYYGIASLGLFLSGGFLWALADSLSLMVCGWTPRLGASARWLHRVGAFWLMLAALVSSQDRWFGRPRLHEDFAELAGLFLGLAFIGWTYGLMRAIGGSASRSSAAGKDPDAQAGVKTARLTFHLLRGKLGLKIVLVLLALIPLGGLLLSRAALCLAYAWDPPADYERFKHSLLCSLAFWEWIGALCLYLFLAVTTFLLKPPSSDEISSKDTRF